MLRLDSLKVGTVVAIARFGGWSTHSQGPYTVVKANKLKVVLRRESDGYERTFSVKRGVELPKNKGGYEDRNTFVETIADMDARAAKQQRERERNSAWSKAEQAAKDKRISELRQALADLELLVDTQ